MCNQLAAQWEALQGRSVARLEVLGVQRVLSESRLLQSAWLAVPSGLPIRVRGKIISWVFSFCRAGLCARYFAPASVPSVLFGMSELASIALTLRALMIGRVDASNTGLAVPLLYCLPLLMRQAETPTLFAFPFAVAAFMQIGLRTLMLGRITIGVPVFVKLLDKGPWSYLRHPLCLVEIAQITLFALTFPTLWNLGCLVVILPGMVATVLLEERFLLTVPEYQEYTCRVRWRLLPGIF